jgi:hypothetical protein
MLLPSKDATEPMVPSGYKLKIITSIVLRSPPGLGEPLLSIRVTCDHGYVQLVILTQRMPLAEQKLFTLP